jgi:hypothetical protein
MNHGEIIESRGANGQRLPGRRIGHLLVSLSGSRSVVAWSAVILAWVGAELALTVCLLPLGTAAAIRAAFLGLVHKSGLSRYPVDE